MSSENHEISTLKEQNYVCISFVCHKDHKISAVRVAGVFDKSSEAEEHCKKVLEEDDSLNVYVGEVGKLLAFNPEDHQVKNTRYANEKLDALCSKLNEESDQKKVEFEIRKNTEMKKLAETNLENVSNRDVYDEAEIKKFEEQIKNFDKEIKKLKESN